MDTKLVQQLLSDLQKNRKVLEKKVQTIHETEYIATSGGGLCEVVMNGKYEMVRCRLDDKVLGDKETMEDLIVTAVNDVLKRINSEMKKVELDFMPKGLF